MRDDIKHRNLRLLGKFAVGNEVVTRKAGEKGNFLIRIGWSTERLKDNFFPTRKFEDTEESRRCRCVTQTDMNDQWKELCEEMEAEVSME